MDFFFLDLSACDSWSRAGDGQSAPEMQPKRASPKLNPTTGLENEGASELMTYLFCGWSGVLGREIPNRPHNNQLDEEQLIVVWFANMVSIQKLEENWRINTLQTWKKQNNLI